LRAEYDQQTNEQKDKQEDKAHSLDKRKERGKADEDSVRRPVDSELETKNNNQAKHTVSEPAQVDFRSVLKKTTPAERISAPASTTEAEIPAKNPQKSEKSNGAPNTKGKKVVEKEVCGVCGKVVYTTEKIVANEIIFHKACFR